jgi:hypothetical protein
MRLRLYCSAIIFNTVETGTLSNWSDIFSPASSGPATVEEYKKIMLMTENIVNFFMIDPLQE